MLPFSFRGLHLGSLASLLGGLAVLLASLHVAAAQVSPAETKAESQPDAKQTVDPYGRTSPRGTVNGYLKAIREDNFEKAALFLDVVGQPASAQPRIAAKRAEQLKDLLDHGGYFFKINEISTAKSGNLKDELDADLEQVGVLGSGDGSTQLILQRVDRDDGKKIWLVSKSIVERLPSLLRTAHQSLLDAVLPASLKTEKIATVPIGHWLAVIIIAMLSLGLGYLASKVCLYLLERVFAPHSRPNARAAFETVLVPLGLVIAMPLYRFSVIQLGVQVVARGVTDWIAVVVSWLALAWLGMRLVDGVAEYARRNASHTDQLTSVAAIALARRIAKAAIAALAVITVLDVLGFDVTTGLAALGIGGLAFALGAQRTVENLVGSVTVVADKPVRVGDFCKFGDISGTVEDIGIRSTQIRTPNRTVVTVPNGAFASMQIENFSVRDKFLFDTVLSLRYETTPAQIQLVLERTRVLLLETSSVENDPARVRLTELASSSIDIEIYAHVYATEYAAFLEIQEELLLGFMNIVAQSGTDFAFPSQTLYLGRDAFDKSQRTGRENRNSKSPRRDVELVS